MPFCPSVWQVLIVIQHPCLDEGPNTTEQRAELITRNSRNTLVTVWTQLEDEKAKDWAHFHLWSRTNLNNNYAYKQKATMMRFLSINSCQFGLRGGERQIHQNNLWSHWEFIIRSFTGSQGLKLDVMYLANFSCSKIKFEVLLNENVI